MRLRLSVAVSVLAVALTAPTVAQDNNSSEVIQNAVGNRATVTQTGSTTISEIDQAGGSSRAAQGRANHIANFGQNAVQLVP